MTRAPLATEPQATILVVADAVEAQQVLHTLLTQAGYRILVVASAQDALVAFERTPADLIVLDVGLPRLDAFNVLWQIREQLGAHPPIIMLSADTERSNVVLSLELGADTYLPKPIWSEELSARIETLLRRTRARQTT